MTKEYALHLLNQLMIGASVDAKPIIPQYELAQALNLAIQALEQQPSEDCISRTKLLSRIDEERKHLLNLKMDGAEHIIVHHARRIIEDMPSVTPKYTDEEIDKAQAIEQAYVDKMVELAVEESRREWLNSFDTASATKCFEAVNILKERLEREET